MAKDQYAELSAMGREALQRGDNPRSLTDEDYTKFVEVNGGSDPTLSPEAEAEAETMEGDE